MKKLICVLTLALALAPSLQAKTENNKADEIIEQYLKMPHPEKDGLGEARQARWEILGRLMAMPETAVGAVARALPKIKEAAQRRELTGFLTSYFQTPESAEVLCELLKDKDKQVRWEAIHSNVSEQGFTDRQASGPMKHWEHTHRFTAEGDGLTRISEHVEYEHHSGWRGVRSRLLFSRPALWLLFSYRKVVTRRAVRGN